MRSLMIFIIALFVEWKVNAFWIESAQPANRITKGPIENYTFNQILDHFDTENPPQYWSQRYAANREFFSKKEDAPIFLRLGGESPYQPIFLLATAWSEWAEEYGAMMYLLEHRYFGESYPTKDTSTENLKYLTTQQALADIANFIKQTNEENGYTSKNKWVVFGGSYVGIIAAWLRLHYPDLVFASVSSSAPLEAKVDNAGYNDLVFEQLNRYAPGCGDAVNQAYNTLTDIMTSGSESDIQEMIDEFSICPSFNASNFQDRGLFYKASESGLTDVVQFNGQVNHPYSITGICNDYFLNADLGDPLGRLIVRYQDRTSYKEKGTCNDVSLQYFLSVMSDDQYSSGVNGKRQWFYLLCNELGYSQTSSTKSSLFSDGLPVEYYTKQCTDIFGEEFGEERMKKGVEETNQRNQGLDIKVTNVVFVQGSVDPWHSLGMINNPTEDSPQVYIDGPASFHCSDMDGHINSPPDYRVKALDEISKYMKKWLS